ncbi:MAG: hypothetical protein CMM32_06875 [Rhodospirillaceae bacterium]|nr:hypothetical protein [Rhodospirillaceae bacterium]
MRILCICYCFSPAAIPEAYVSAKIMGAIPKADITVLTLAPQAHPGRPDHSLEGYIKERFHEILYVGGSWSSYLGKIPRLPFRPDRYLLLNRIVRNQAETLRPTTFDVIVTRSQYHSVHGVGHSLKKRYPDIPWVASFSDPWSGDIYERSIPLASSWSHRLEKQVFSSANALVFPTREMAKFVGRQHPTMYLAEKSHVLPHCFDPILYKNASPRKPSDVLDVGIFGSFYGPRSPILLLEAINLALSKFEMPHFVVKVFGKGRSILNDALEDFPAVKRHVVHAGELQYSTALAKMETLDMLLLFDAPMAPPSIYLPSKLIDYLGAKRPIFAITPEGASSDLVREIGGWTANPENPAEVALRFSESLKKVKRGNFKANEEIISHYSSREIGARFSQILESLVSK